MLISLQLWTWFWNETIFQLISCVSNVRTNYWQKCIWQSAVIGHTQLLVRCDWSYTAVGLLWLVVHSFWPPVIGQFLKFLTCESDRVSGYSSISVGGISAVLQPCRPNLSSTDWWYSSLCDNNTCLSLLNCQHKPQLHDQCLKSRLELQIYSLETRL